MRNIFLLVFVLLQTFWVAGQRKTSPYVVLVSFDGFRSDYVERYNLPNFKAFINEGAAAKGLIPSFPSKTFPNHYTLVTGLYPGHHGLVDNNFYDPSKKEVYSMRDQKTLTDSSYYGGTPLWQLAKQHQLTSASYFWVGSELNSERLRPEYYFKYDQSVPFEERVSKVISWLNLPESERPHLITLYFSSPDTESHEFGPFAEQTKTKLLQIDSLLGQFMKTIKGINLPINVILVSDHGMLEIKEEIENYIFLDELVKTNGAITVVNGGTQAHVYTKNDSRIDSLYTVLKSRAKTFSVLKAKDFPPHWKYENPRSGNLLLVANPGKYIVTGDRKEFIKELEQGKTFGAHGYDPSVVKDMYGIFYAAGPNIKKGVVIEAFQNIHVYPLITQILEIATPPIDGSPEVLKPVYKK